MAYNSNKGPQHTGDLQYEGDPNDVQIDFENDEIALKTGGVQRVVLTNAELSSSGIFRSAGSLSGSGDIALTGAMHAANFYGDGSGLSSVGATSVSGAARVYSTTGLETAGYLKVTGSTTRTGAVSGSNTFHNVGAATFGGTIAASSSISSSAGLVGNVLDIGESDFIVTADGAVSGSGTVTCTSISASADVIISGNVGIGTTSPAYDLHVNGPGVTIATIDAAAGNDAFLRLNTATVEKAYIKQGSGGNTIITNDVASKNIQLQARPAAGAAETYITVDGAAESILIAKPVSASSTLHNDGAATFSSTLAVSGTTTMKGQLTVINGVDAEFLGNTTFGNAAGDLVTFVARSEFNAPISSSATFHNVGTATFGAPVASSGSVTAVGLYSTDLISGSLGLHVDSPATFGGDVAVTGNVGIGTGSPLTALDVRHNPTTLSNDTGGGEVVKFGTGTLTTGKMYYLHSGSSWEETDMILAESGGIGMLGIAIGSSPATNGLLVRGFFDVHSYLSGAFAVGQPVYVSAPGYLTTMRPSGSAEIVRQVGYCTTTANVIYFNPSAEYIELV